MVYTRSATHRYKCNTHGSGTRGNNLGNGAHATDSKWRCEQEQEEEKETFNTETRGRVSPIHYGKFCYNWSRSDARGILYGV